MSESLDDQLARLERMIEDSPTWPLGLATTAALNEIARLRTALSSLGRAAKTLVSCCVDGQNELHGIKHGGPAKRTLRDIERCLETMAAEAAEAAGGDDV